MVVPSPSSLPSRSKSRGHKGYLATTIVVSLVGLYWFAAAFFLAKQSLSHRSTCDDGVQLLREQLGLTNPEIKALQSSGLLSRPEQEHRTGCWTPRTVDSLVVLVVDALRFDFAYYHLPKSIGKRLSLMKENETHNQTTVGGISKLLQFVADPPTVTMQRLKALTTGGLPTFADISANFGGATVEEDSWIARLGAVPPRSRNRTASRLGFVGDDTWVDLFPEAFVEAYPYPSFNTRDLETVDNGCLFRMPRLLSLVQEEEQSSSLEVLVVHFLGVDHVGHTYGPVNEHMDTKLKQMDTALAGVLDLMDDEKDKCRAALIMGDHGMTPDGNHGGGTHEETHAALFVHTSPACGGSGGSTKNKLIHKAVYEALEPATRSDLVHKEDGLTDTFSEIHQIDLVPTISYMLGLPIPFANLGSFVPSLVGDERSVQSVVLALALNAAQVWRYLSVYSQTANPLPDLDKLHDKLALAVSVYQEALSSDTSLSDRNQDEQTEEELDTYMQVASLFKIFLMDALDLGQRVWTRFDSVGMTLGILLLTTGLVLYVQQTVSLSRRQGRALPLPQSQVWETAIAALFVFFTCGALTFSNSYILEEENVLMYALAVLSMVLAVRLATDPNPSYVMAAAVLVLPLAARLHELTVSGHGLDPSIRLHVAHRADVFLACLAGLGISRWWLYRHQVTFSLTHMVADVVALTTLAISWWEKRSPDMERNGYIACRVALGLLFAGIPWSIYQGVTRRVDPKAGLALRQVKSDCITVVVKMLFAIMGVTGPSTAASVVLFSFQALVVYHLAGLSKGPPAVSPWVLTVLWKLTCRHSFFATNHGCAFSRLQYSSAFVATKEFVYATGGISLFLNTFGWEMVGLMLAWLWSRRQGSVWRIYGALQLLEALASCLSVSLLRRHLMVWDIYAPHFIFVAIFTVLTGASQLLVLVLSS